jgi:hypothetical protein
MFTPFTDARNLVPALDAHYEANWVRFCTRAYNVGSARAFATFHDQECVLNWYTFPNDPTDNECYDFAPETTGVKDAAMWEYVRGLNYDEITVFWFNRLDLATSESDPRKGV